MAKVSKHYGIKGSVEFIDVNVSKDNQLFVDPRALRLQSRPGRFAAQANTCTRSFFDEVARCAVSNQQSDAARGLDLLQHFKEPKETRLGLSKKGIDGHGGADDVGRAIWDALSTNINALLSIGILKLIEDVPIFVEGVDKDITSDLTTRIIYEPLAKFTQAMVVKHAQFTKGRHSTDIFDRQVWNPRKLRWEIKQLELPVAEGKPLVLVPRDWVQPHLMMSATRYYETTMLSFVQEDRAVVDRAGKLVTDPKWVLKKKRELKRGRNTIIRVTQDAQTKQEDLLDRFRSFVDSRYRRLEDEEIDAKTQ